MKKEGLVEDRILHFLSLYISKLIEGDAPSKIKRRLSHNVFLTMSFSHRLSHNVIHETSLTTSQSAISHYLFLTTSFSQRLS